MLHLTQTEFHQIIFKRPVKQEEEIGYSLYHSTFESSIDEERCKGRTKSIRIREGITFLQVELTFFQDTEVEMLSTQPQVGFCFCLKGESTAYVLDVPGCESNTFSLSIRERLVFVYANPSSRGYQHFGAHQTLQSVYIHFSYDSFKELLGDSMEQLPKDFVEALSFKRNYYLHATQIPRATLALCHALVSNPFKGKSGEFYTEAKAIELIAHQLDYLLSLHAKETPLSLPPLSPLELQKLEDCYAELQNHLDSPPSLIELAKKTGLSVYRLKNGFVQKYGDTPFRLLTELRMLEAKRLLQKGEQNVSEVAMEVGYSSLGTFSNTFFQRFGHRPSTYKKSS